MGTLDGSENDPALASAVHRNVKNVVYSVTRTHAMNIGDATIVAVTPWWQVTLYIAAAVMTIMAAGCVVMMVRTQKKTKERSSK